MQVKLSPGFELCSGLASLLLAKTLPTAGPEKAWEGFNGHKSEHLLSNCLILRFQTAILTRLAARRGA